MKSKSSCKSSTWPRPLSVRTRDHKLVSRLRKGTTVTLQTAEMVRAYMEQKRYELRNEQKRKQRAEAKKTGPADGGGVSTT